MIRAVVLALARAAAGMGRRKLLSALTSGAVALGLVLLAMTMWIGDNVASWSAQWQHGVDLVIYLDRDVSAQRMSEIATVLGEIEAVESVVEISPEAALRRLSAELGEDVLAGIDASALSPSVEVGLSSGTRDVALAHPVVERLRSIEGVEDVELLEEWVDDLLIVSSSLDRATAVLMFLSLLACVYVIFVTMQLRARDGREDARVYELFAARAQFVRGPLVAEGLIHGFVGAMLAVAVCALMHQAASPLLSHLSSNLFGVETVVFLQSHRIAALIGVGVAAGVVGSVLATSKRALS